MKKIVSDFIKCGIAGWCLEILFTALHSLQRREMHLKGNTSIWMFFIYGMTAFLTPLFGALRNCSVWLRGSVYAICIFIGEFLSGSLLEKYNMCPWDYSNSRWNIRNIIRLDYFFNWFFAGIFFERLLRRNAPTHAADKHTAL